MDIIEIVRGSVYSELLGLSFEINLFESLHELKVASSEELSRKINCPENLVSSLLEVNVALGLIDRTGDSQFKLNDYNTEFLVLSYDKCVKKTLDQVNKNDLVYLKSGIERFLQDKKIRPPESIENPKELNESELKIFAKYKINDGEFLVQAAHLGGCEVAKLINYSDSKKVVDIGGNDGSFLLPIIKSHPSLYGVIADLPALEKRANIKIASSELSERCKFHSLNFFEDDFPKADIYLCGYVLHDWGKSICFYLLKKIFDALPVGGELILHENLLDDYAKSLCFWSMHTEFLLREGTGGILRTSKEYSSWLVEVGFRVTDVKFGTGKSFIFAIKE
jgi:hypothetical protein